jgi:hypothetical protein
MSDDKAQLELEATFTQEQNRQAAVEAEISRALDAAKVRPTLERKDAIPRIISELNKNENVRLSLSDTNKLYCYVDGTRQPLANVIEDLLLTSGLADPQSVTESIADGETPVTIKSKQDLHTAAEKSAFIKRYGYQAWQDLDWKRVADPPRAIRSKADLTSTGGKAKFIAEHGLPAFEALPLK